MGKRRRCGNESGTTKHTKNTKKEKWIRKQEREKEA
jgi:hypothetical protein